jgi:hypothetical protein
MDWQRERDGLITLVVVGVVFGVFAGGGGALGRFATTFLATFLGVLVAFRVESWATSAAGESGRGTPPDERRSASGGEPRRERNEAGRDSAPGEE